MIYPLICIQNITYLCLVCMYIQIRNSTSSLEDTETPFNYKGEDEPIRVAKQNLKISFYLAIVYAALSSIDERCDQLNQVTKTF